MAREGRHPTPPADTPPPGSGPSSLARGDQTQRRGVRGTPPFRSRPPVRTRGLVLPSLSLGSFGQYFTSIFQHISMLGSKLSLEGKDLLACPFLPP